MSTYLITVLEQMEYSIEADTEEEAHDILGMGDEQVVNSRIVDYNIVEMKERVS